MMVALWFVLYKIFNLMLLIFINNPSCVKKTMVFQGLTLSTPITTIVPYANSLDPDEMPSNSGVSSGSKLLTLKHISPTLSDIEAL